MSRVIGIDLGTTNSVVAVLENNRPEVIPNSEGAKTTPSIVHFEPAGDVIVGELAKRQMVAHPERTIRSVKRFMGCRWNEIEKRRRGIGYRLVEDGEGMAAIKVDASVLRPEDVSAEVLKKMKATAEEFLGEEIVNAVITVPAHFNDSQRQATKLAAEKAGLAALRIVNEPTAAALAYGLNRREHNLVAVFDFGGGTFDISILEIDGEIFEVKSTGGDTFLGGDNINQLLCNWICEKIQQQTGIDPRADTQALQRIAETAEMVKCELSSLQKTTISLPFIVADEQAPKHFSAELTREEFEFMIRPVLEKLKPPCEQALADAGVGVQELTAVVLVGGSTRIPAVRRLVEQMFGRKPDCSINPDEVVAAGAAIQAGILNGDLAEVLLLDVTPLSLGIETAGDQFSTIIPRNSNVPTTVNKKFTTCVDNQSSVKIHVMQGERKIASENRSLAHLKLNGIPPAPREIPEIEVSFHIDANGILTVLAMDLTSGNMEQIEVEAYTPALEMDAEKIVEEAEAHAEEDRLFMQKSAVRRRLASMESDLELIREKTREDGFLSEEQQNRIREAFFKLDVALSQEDMKLIDEAERAAQSIYMEITSLLSMKNAAENPDVHELDFQEIQPAEPQKSNDS